MLEHTLLNILLPEKKNENAVKQEIQQRLDDSVRPLELDTVQDPTYTNDNINTCSMRKKRKLGNIWHKEILKQRPQLKKFATKLKNKKKN